MTDLLIKAGLAGLGVLLAQEHVEPKLAGTIPGEKYVAAGLGALAGLYAAKLLK